MGATPFSRRAKDQRDELVLTLAKNLRQSAAPRYRRMKLNDLRQRTELLVDSFLRTLSGDPSPFVRHIEQITQQRISEGFFLTEIQLALSLLEELLWQIAVDHSTIRNLVPHLSLITTTIGQAKDRLAQLYLEHKERAESRVADLERRCASLFQGTEGYVSSDES